MIFVSTCLSLSRLRIRKGLTQSELGSLCNVSKNTICSIENGHHLPSLELTVKLCVALDCKFSDLVEVFDSDTCKKIYF